MRKITSLLMLLLLCAVGASAQITSVSEISATGIYTIVAADNRGALMYQSDYPGYLCTTNKIGGGTGNNGSVDVDATSDAQQWQFESTGTEGQYYIKNVASGTYVGSTNGANPYTLTSTKEAFTIAAGTSNGFTISSSGNNLVNISGWYPYGTDCAWNTQDGGNNFTITKVADSESSAHDVTYTVTLDGETVETVTCSQFPGDAATLPTGKIRDFVTYAYSVSTIEESTTAVTVTATLNLPFEASKSYADAKWYYAKFNANAGGAWVYDASATPNVKTPTTYTAGDENAEWAFIGNPYTGFTIINKAAGADKILATKSGAASDGNSGGNTYAVMTTSDDTVYTLTKWTLANWSSISGGFTIANEENVRLNRRSADNLAYWTYADAGSVVSLIEVPDDYSSNVTSEIAPYFAEGKVGSPFQLTQEVYNTYKDRVTAAQSTCSVSEYKELLAVVHTFSNYQLPESGKYYRIKSSGARNAETYAAVGANAYNRGDKATGYGLKTVDASHAASDASTYFKFTLVSSDANSATYKLSSQGEGVVAPSSTNQPFLMTAAEDAGNDYIFTVRTEGTVNIQDATITDGYGYWHEAGWGTNSDCIVRWGAAATASQWYVEEVTDLTVALHQAGENYYATLNLPFGATVEGATAYTAAQSTEGAWLNLTEVSDIKAGTPVVLIGTSASATIKLNTDAAGTAEGNALSGNNVAMDWVSTYLTLGQVDNVPGFYSWEGTTLGANKAYIANSDDAVRGLAFSIGDKVTGIHGAVEADALNGSKVYDLQGRRVQKAQHGLYIVGGKKVLVK